MEYLRKPQHMAAVITLQSQLRKVRGVKGFKRTDNMSMGVDLQSWQGEPFPAGRAGGPRIEMLPQCRPQSGTRCVANNQTHGRIHVWRQENSNSSNFNVHLTSGGEGCTEASIASAQSFAISAPRAQKMPLHCWQSRRAASTGCTPSTSEMAWMVSFVFFAARCWLAAHLAKVCLSQLG